MGPTGNSGWVFCEQEIQALFCEQDHSRGSYLWAGGHEAPGMTWLAGHPLLSEVSVFREFTVASFSHIAKHRTTSAGECWDNQRAKSYFPVEKYTSANRNGRVKAGCNRSSRGLQENQSVVIARFLFRALTTHTLGCCATHLTRSISFTALAEARLKHLGCSAFAAILIALRIEKQKGREQEKEWQQQESEEHTEMCWRNERG